MVHWKFNEAEGPLALDSSAKNNIGALMGDLQRYGPPGDRWLRFRGAQQVVGPDALVDTDQGFTLAAWASIHDVTRSCTVLSEDGRNTSGFSLRYDASSRHWTLAMPVADSSAARVDIVSSASTPTPYTWTHLIAAFDDVHNELQLYVDGVLQGTAGHTHTWRASGPFVVGRGMALGAPGHFCEGDLDGIRAYPYSMNTHQVSELYATLGKE
ncbi:LamG domain-containing protein [Streptomyces sp. NPDC020800]|uniref:LamG domain-containing protein n=1 Tax=Streptomyces sp. NPDC020800 TaxID=3365092 RepID=UPI0037A63365